MRKIIGSLLLLVFFFSGSFSFQYKLPHSQVNHFTGEFLSGDKLLATVDDVNQDSIGFRKMIVSVEGIIRKSKDQGAIGKLLCYVDSDNRLNTGDQVVISPKLITIKNKGNLGEFDASSYWKYQGINRMCFLRENDIKIISKDGDFNSFWGSMRETVKQILYTHLSNHNASVATALVLGDKSELSAERRNAYANAGAMHVLAVSGMHVGILLGFLQWLFYRISWLRKRSIYVVVALIFVWTFAFLTGLSASVLRASLMFSILALGQLRGYSFFSINALFVSALVILFLDPSALFHIGFQLSFLAMLGISFFFGPIRNLVNSRSKLVNYFWDGTALGLAAQIGTIPISLYYFHQFPSYFILTNLGLLVLAGGALISVFIMMILTWIPFVGGLIGYVVDIIFTLLNEFIEFINDLPGTISSGYTPTQLWVLAIYIMLVVLIYSWRKGRRLGFYAAFSTIFLLGVLLVVKREYNRASSVLIIPNHKYNIVLVKVPNELICLYPSVDVEKEEVELLTNSAAKVFGVTPSYISYQMKEQIKLSAEITVKAENDLYINYYDQIIRRTEECNNELRQNERCISNKELKNSFWSIRKTEVFETNDKQF